LTTTTETQPWSTISGFGMTPGAVLRGEVVDFCVWAPAADGVELHLVHPSVKLILMDRDPRGYHRTTVQASAGTRYFYRLHGKDYPDPASRSQPEGVHASSEVPEPTFGWTDQDWRGLPLRELIFYELHVGTFSESGSFAAVIHHLDELAELGITAIELMPIAQFPGTRNWGYDGVFPYAPHNSYGRPADLKRLVDAAHQRGIAVAIDVVYNHLGPEGNYLDAFGPYFTDRYRTPWGRALNFDGPDSEPVREFFLNSALLWVTDYHVDVLRVDAVHAIADQSAYPFLQQLAEGVHERAEQLGRKVYVIAESDLNDPRLVRTRELGGYGMDGQWNDDFHHALHRLLTGESSGYYGDFGSVNDLAKALRDGFVYEGNYSEFRRRRHGAPARDISPVRFVVCSQNHDQVGNRLRGERLATLVSYEQLKLAAGVVLLSPYLPLLFMGEEYGESSPFQYFVSHSDPDLIEAVRNGRREEFALFHWEGEAPEPQEEATFLRSRLRRSNLEENQVLRALYQELIRLRKEHAALMPPTQRHIDAHALENERVLVVRRWTSGQQIITIFNFGEQPVTRRPSVPSGRWRLLLDSADRRWLGAGSALPSTTDFSGAFHMQPYSFAVFMSDST
jgi:maltooligosyltrehalose trehalohydrolase